MNKQPIKVGVVGCGFVSQQVHIPALHRAKGAEVVAICDTNSVVAQHTARKFGISKVYIDFDEMLIKERLDVIVICTSINMHAPLAIQSMEAGCDVLMEKPMTTSVAEADDEIAVARRTGKTICVIHQLLFHPVVMGMKQIVKSGSLGKITRIEIRQGCPPCDYPPIADPAHWWHKLPGGVYGDTLVHPLYLAREFLGNITPLSVHASKIGNCAHLPVDDLQVVLRGDVGMGTIISSCNWPSLWEIEVFGTEQIAHCDLNNSYMVLFDCKTNNGRGIPSLYARQNLDRSIQILTNSLRTGMDLIRGEHRGHFVQIQKFIYSVQNGTPPPVTAEDDREITRLLGQIVSKM